MVLVGACGAEPEKLLVGCWKETAWTYERADTNGETPQGLWNDGIRIREYPDRQVIRHEAEGWEFKSRGDLVIRGREGDLHHAQWRLKGRGHVLTIWHEDDQFEVYDIKELNRDELILHYDMGMEVRGIARLEFTRTSCDSQPARADAPEEDLALATQPRSGTAS
jgi:hypothetical protein